MLRHITDSSKRSATEQNVVALAYRARLIAARAPEEVVPMLRELIIQREPAAKARYQYGCRNKCQYLTQRSAQGAVVAMFEKGEYTMIEYECCFCGFWHIGHFSMKQFPPAADHIKRALIDKNQKKR